MHAMHMVWQIYHRYCIGPGDKVNTIAIVLFHFFAAIPEIVSVINVETAAISLKWKLKERDGLDHFMVECSSVSYIARLLVNNQTYFAQLSGLLPYADYNCCISAVFDTYKTQSCTSISNGAAVQYTGSGSASANNANAVGGVLGFIIIILLLALVLAVVALVYPCLIRPKLAQNYGILSRYAMVMN